MPFQRSLSEPIMKNLQKEPLFHERLVPDIRNPQNFQKGNVFAAVRNDQVAFYYKGGKLFGYDGKVFKTHVKHAVKVDINKDDPYVSESDLSKASLIHDFYTTYDAVKTQCGALSGTEATFVSELYKRSYIHHQKYPVVLLDIEVAFSDTSEEAEKATNRIDILLYNQETKRLRFVEAKLFSNPAVRSTTTPEVVEQIDRYNKQIVASESEILAAYSRYIEIVNTLFSINLSPPLGVDKFTELVIVDFTMADKNDFTFKNLEQQLWDNNIPYYAIQNLTGAKITHALWNNLKGKPSL